MKENQIEIGEHIHGHLGPFLIIGLKMGNLALKKLNAKKYFGMKVFADTGTITPMSCMLDGIQVSTGCTLGKGNIKVSNERIPRARFESNGDKFIVELKPKWLKKIRTMLKEKNERVVADLIWNTDHEELFDLS